MVVHVSNKVIFFEIIRMIYTPRFCLRPKVEKGLFYLIEGRKTYVGLLMLLLGIYYKKTFTSAMDIAQPAKCVRLTKAYNIS